ncbi:hypothetical protein JMJ77_0003768, partial [Colletotrichum scovillei]
MHDTADSDPPMLRLLSPALANSTPICSNLSTSKCLGP